MEYSSTNDDHLLLVCIIESLICIELREVSCRVNSRNAIVKYVPRNNDHVDNTILLSCSLLPDLRVVLNTILYVPSNTALSLSPFNFSSV